jgi:SAM-dependent methyltransferase
MAMTDHHCPLCKSHDSELLEVIDAAAIARVYAAKLGIDARFSAPQLQYRHCGVCGLQYFHPPEPGDAQLYEQLQRFDWYYMEEKWEYSYAARHIDRNDRVLEVGAGRAAFAKLVGNDRYTGLEFNDCAIEKAHADGVRLLKQPVEEHAEAGHSYDAVVSFQVLEHVPDPDAFIRGCIACLKAGGKLILSVPAHDGFANKAVNHVLDMPPHHVSHWSKAVMAYLPRRYGLDVIDIAHEPVAAYHVNWAKRIKVEDALRRRLGLPRKLLDVTWSARMIGLVSLVLARFLPISVPMELGHTITAVYRKR